MNEIIITDEKFGEIRTLDKKGTVLFCGSDIARALGYADTAQAIKLHCNEDDVTIYPLVDNMGRVRPAKFINESNVYRLITHSNLPTAEKKAAFRLVVLRVFSDEIQ